MIKHTNSSVWQDRAQAGINPLLVYHSKRERIISVGENTVRLDAQSRDLLPDIPTLPYGAQPDTLHTVTLPVHLVNAADSEQRIRWWIALEGLGQAGTALGIEILGDVVLGRMGSADLDLEPYGAHRKGVSRRHALLRPTANRLYMIDLDSTNGTRHNALTLGAGQAREICDGDIITLGSLSLGVRIIRSPKEWGGSQLS